MVPFTGKREDALVRHGRWRDEGRERLHEWEEGTGGLVKNYGRTWSLAGSFQKKQGQFFTLVAFDRRWVVPPTRIVSALRTTDCLTPNGQLAFGYSLVFLLPSCHPFPNI